ncbi:PLP-dependent aminotransferase family protein [Leisingera sp.]|uniref:aminotransferase-like domain-containing protein n=1 Tax=Leisingera sp. TaxID=1879318 RepID=UPI002B27A497|nr:PLP-dependent aminotransferase family protein [Leisingera sp.]
MQFDQIFASRNARMKASAIRELLKLLDQPDIISFAGGIPDSALFPTDEFAKAFKNSLSPERQAMALQYSVSEGYMPLREWIVGEMAKIGIVCDPGNVLITSGSQQALDYLGKLFLSPGDTALVGWPTYLGALAAFNAYEPRYDRLSLKGDRTAESYAVGAAEAGSVVKFAYLSPDFANPTGETLDRTCRLQMLEVAEELDCAIIEDAAYQSLRYDGEAVPPVLALELEQKGTVEDCRTVYCGTFSKTLAPGVRIGWAVAAKPVISQMVLLKQAADLHTSTINQMAVHAVAKACFDAHVEQLHAVYQRRRDVMLAALEEHMPEGVNWTRPEGGMFVWMTLPDGADGTRLLARSLETEKVAFVPGQAFFADDSGQNTIRLSFSKSNHAAIQEGIARLGRLLRSV